MLAPAVACDEAQNRGTGGAAAAEETPAGAGGEFTTDFSRRNVPLDEIRSGGPPKDGIPAIDEPAFVGAAEADRWLEDREPVILVRAGGETSAYPIQIVVWHEIVNDTVGGVPLSVTFCPLCNTAVAFERTVDGRVLDFGTTGRLRFSNLIMYDRQTESWWQQATGEAIVGELTGHALRPRPAPILPWREVRTSHPEARVLSRRTGFARRYGENPYAGYDDPGSSPFLYNGPGTPSDLPPMARVITVDRGGASVAYPYSELREARVVNDRVAGELVAVFWREGTASALDEEAVAAGRDVGSAAVFGRRLGERTLTFRAAGDRILDTATGSEWNLLGEAVDGELAGSKLEPVASIDHFWFSWAAFRPETRIYTTESER